jgi:hypothetical protein
MAKLLTNPADFRKQADKCARLAKATHAPILKRLLRERAALLVKTAIEMERAEALGADRPTKASPWFSAARRASGLQRV